MTARATSCFRDSNLEPESVGSRHRRRIAVDGVLTPDLIGDAVRADEHDVRSIKRVWRLLVRLVGRPRRPSG